MLLFLDKLFLGNTEEEHFRALKITTSGAEMPALIKPAPLTLASISLRCVPHEKLHATPLSYMVLYELFQHILKISTALEQIWKANLKEGILGGYLFPRS